MKIQNERKPHFSVSQLTTYLQCPLAYYFQYELGLAWKVTPSAVAFGKCMHRAIETMNVCRKQGQEVSQDDLLRSFSRQWADTIEAGHVGWKKPEEPAELLTKGQCLLEEYYRQFRKCQYSDVELGFRLPILDAATGLYVQSRDIVGYIDAIDNGSTIVEYKTTGRTPNQHQVDSDLQLTLYSWAYRMLYGIPEDRIIVVNLVKTKEPKIEVVETHREEEDYTKLIGLMQQVIRAVDQRLFYPNPIGGFGCGTCNYAEECRKEWPI